MEAREGQVIAIIPPFDCGGRPRARAINPLSQFFMGAGFYMCTY